MASDGSLSQEEIDALLSGTAFEPASDSAAPPPAAAAPAPAAPVTDESMRSLGERLQRAVSSAVTVTSTLFERNVGMTQKGLEKRTAEELRSEPEALVAFELEIMGAKSGPMAVLLTDDVAKAIADLMMGGDATNPPAELDELYLSAIKEYVSQMVNAMMTAISTETAGDISPTPPEGRRIEPATETSLPLGSVGEIAVAEYSCEVEGAASGRMLILLSPPAVEAISGAKPPPPSVTVMPPPAAPPSGSSGGVEVSSVKFPELTSTVTEVQAKNIELLMDVPMQLTVELGRTTMMIRDVLELGTGSIIELEKLAGEPVDLLVNGKLIAKGEVVVIDENFGVRVTDIVSPLERLTGIK